MKEQLQRNTWQRTYARTVRDSGRRDIQQTTRPSEKLRNSAPKLNEGDCQIVRGKALHLLNLVTRGSLEGEFCGKVMGNLEVKIHKICCGLLNELP